MKSGGHADSDVVDGGKVSEKVLKARYGFRNIVSPPASAARVASKMEAIEGSAE
jgi:hypothetical protein